MTRFLLNPIVLGFATFLISLFVSGQIFDLRARCHDGSLSSAIGRQGACSHHGGVDRSRGGFATVVSLVNGFVVGGAVSNHHNRSGRLGTPTINRGRRMASNYVSASAPTPIVDLNENELAKLKLGFERQAALTAQYLARETGRFAGRNNIPLKRVRKRKR